MEGKSTYAPIVVTVYDRLDHLQRCIEALKSNSLASESELFVLSDAAKNDVVKGKIEEVRRYILTITGFKKVSHIFQESNKGAHQSIIEGVERVLSSYDSFIFLEDDIVVSSDFLDYMNKGLLYYKEDKNIFSICSFSLPFQFPPHYTNDIYFYSCNSPWGFATWKNRWQKVDLSYFDRNKALRKNKKLYRKFLSIGFYIKGILQADSSQGIVATDLRIYYHMVINDMCSVFPVVSKSQNWGFDGSGEHCDNPKAWWTLPSLETNNKPTEFIPFTGYDDEILKRHRQFQDTINGGILARYLKYTWIHRIYKKWRRK